jgi:hypothetical protein
LHKHLISRAFPFCYFSSLQARLQMPIGALMMVADPLPPTKEKPQGWCPLGMSRTPELLSNLLALRREFRQCTFIVAANASSMKSRRGLLA